MRKGLRMIRCSGCDKIIWRNDVEGWCHECKKFYTMLARNQHAVQTEFVESEE